MGQSVKVRHLLAVLYFLSQYFPPRFGAVPLFTLYGHFIISRLVFPSNAG